MEVINKQIDFNPSFKKKIISILDKLFIKPTYPVLTFYLLILTGIACFIMTWIDTGFVVPLYGDYNLQMMNFIYDAYDKWHIFYETGHFVQWDRSIFIGVDNVGGNSFYYLFDPLMIIATFFPRSWLLVEQGISFVLKMALGGMFFYWYLGEFKLSPRIKMIGAICFGFNGYIFQYLWFHFIEVETFFPLALLGVEKLLKKKDPRYLMVAFLLIGFCNYFFFVVYMIGAFLYWCFRYLQDIFRRTKQDNLAIFGFSFFGFFIAVLLGCITLLPGMSLALSMPRVNNTTSYLSTILQAEGFKAKLDALLTYSYSFNKLTPLFNTIFAPNNCYYSNILPIYWYDNLSGSMYVTTPITILFFTSLVQSIKDKKISHIIAILLVLLLVFTPFGFYLFTGFTVGYARYFILPMSWMLTYSLITLSKRREITRSTFDLGFALTLMIMGICFILDLYYISKNESTGWFEGTDWEYRIYEIIITIVWAIVIYMILRPFFHKKQFNAIMTFLCMVDVIAFANVVIYCQGYCNMSSYAGGNSAISEETYIAEKLKESEGNDFYRIHSSNQMKNINISIREGFNGIGAFHSAYAFAAQDFIDRSRIPFYYHDWEMAVYNQRYNLETFLGMKYYFLPKDNFKYDKTDQVPDTYNNVPLGYKNLLDLTESDMKELGITYSEELLNYLKSDECSKACFVNTNFIDTGFSFDEAIDTDWLYYKNGKETYNRYEDINEYPLLRYAMLDHDDYEKLTDDGVFKKNTFHVNGVEQTINQTDKEKQSDEFLNMLVSKDDYEEGKSSPIQHYYGSSMIKATVYAANWPETENNTSGEYLYDVVDGKNIFYEDMYDDYGFLIPSLKEWKRENPFLYKNGIYPADTKFDYYTKRKDDGTYYNNGNQVYYNSKVVYTAIKTYYKNGKLVKEETTFGQEIDGNDGYYISIDDTNNMDWRFYDENDNLIESARHTYQQYKRAHGYYSPVPVKTIVGVTRAGTKEEPNNLHSPSIYVQPYSDYLKAIKNLKDNSISIISRNDDMVQFKTNYDKQRFVVLNYPNEKGWSIKEKVTDSQAANGYVYKDVTTYKSQGGFVGFVAEKGEHEYVLSYTNTNFVIGSIFTAIGAFVTFITICLMTRRNKKEVNLYQLTLKTGFDEEIIKEKWNYEDCQDL